MELVRLIRSRVEKAPRPDPKMVRAQKPERNEFVISSPAEDGGLLLSAPLETQLSGFLATVGKRMKNLPKEKTFALDPVGAFVWEQCDGVNSFEKIARKLQDRYKMNRLEAETALAAYLQTLSTRKLIQMQRGPSSKSS